MLAVACDAEFTGTALPFQSETVRFPAPFSWVTETRCSDQKALLLPTPLLDSLQVMVHDTSALCAGLATSRS